MTFYAALMNATGKAYFIENCHWGDCDDSDDSSCPTLDWCPFNWYRTSGDINNSPFSWLRNLQTTIRFQDPVNPLSRPGCWAYPDMLEVGRISVNGKIDQGWNQAHFGAWCVISAPLILGMDLTQTHQVEAVIDTITNVEAIAVNQAWAGHPGTLVWSGLGGARGFPAARKCDAVNPGLKQQGWSLSPLANGNTAVKAPGGGCLMQQGPGFEGGAGGLILADCNATSPAQIFSYNQTTFQLTQVSSKHCVDVHGGGPIVWMYGCSSKANDLLHFNAAQQTLSVPLNGGLCFGVEAADPAGGAYQETLQAWAKPLEGIDGVAVLLINPDTKPHDFEVPISNLPKANGKVNMTGSALNVRDIWAHADLAALPKGTAFIKTTVGPMDSAFLRLSVA